LGVGHGSVLDPAGGSSPDPRYTLALRVLTMRVHPTFFDLATLLGDTYWASRLYSR